MNLIDLIIIVILASSVLAGLREGFIVEFAGTVGAIVALAVARVEYVPVRSFLRAIFPGSSWLTIVAYLIVFFVVWALIIAIARVLRRVTRLLLLGLLDRLAGALLGLFQGALLVELLLFLARRVPRHDTSLLGLRIPDQELHQLINHAKLASAFLHMVPLIEQFFPHF